jgi:LytS/YehU family sensor histidine kinase
VAFYRSYIDRSKAAARLEAQLANAQFERLRNQLQPHFLFNTLNTVSSLVLSEKNSDAYDAVADLAELLRISLERGESQFVTLSEELEFNQLYLSLMARRFPDRLQVNLKTDDETLDAEVPGLILQPLIENAVKYGVSEDSAISRIIVCARREKDRLVLSVENDVGSVRDNDSDHGSGIGLTHTRERLQLHYGDNCRIESGMTQSGGFRVQITIPFKLGATRAKPLTAKNAKITNSYRR